MYSQAAIKANYFENLNEGMKLLDKKLLENSMTMINDFKEIKQGTHLSWPVEVSPSLLEMINSARVSDARHHSLITRVFRQLGKIEVINFSGTDKSDAKIRRDVVNLHPMMAKKVVGHHVYKQLRSYDAFMTIKRAEKSLDTCGAYGSVYDLQKNNCEHAVKFFKTGAAFSLQTGNFHVPE